MARPTRLGSWVVVGCGLLLVAACPSDPPPARIDAAVVDAAVPDAAVADAAVADAALIDAVTAVDGGVLVVPVLVAPPTSPVAPPTFDEEMGFLYTGADPVQTGVAPGAIVARRAAVLRGRVRFVDGTPAPGARVAIVGHPEYGATHSRADGAYDLAVNGGGQLAVRVERPGAPEVRRTVEVPEQDYVAVGDVVLVPYDATVSLLAGNSGAQQVAVGSPSTDADGTRRPYLVVAPNTTAEAVRPDGTRVALTTMAVRLTEYTVGAAGPQAMPAPLPLGSGYTYCVEVSADEALALGATTVVLGQPAALIVDNFLDIPTGTVVPNGSFDSARGIWVADRDGKVIAVVAGGLDSDGDGVADNALGLAAAEVAELRGRFAVGQSFWRAEITHFSPHDLNFYQRNNLPLPPPELPDPPDPSAPSAPKGGGGDAEGTRHHKSCYPNCAPAHGSVIRTESQALGEDLDVVGAPFRLHHESTRVRGRTDSYLLDFPLIDQVSPNVTSIDVEVLIAGQRITRRYAGAELVANLRFRHTWDGRDGYGRLVQGARKTAISVYRNVPAEYWLTTTSTGSSFGQPAPADATAAPGRGTVYIPQRFEGVAGTWRADGAALGGWTISSHHRLDPVGTTLHLGSGATRPDVRLSDTRPGTITRYAGVLAPTGELGDNGPASAAEIFLSDLVVAADGSLVIADLGHNRIRRIDRAGVITTIAGTGAQDNTGDGGPATAAAIVAPRRLEAAPDGSLYVLTTGLPPVPMGPPGHPAAIRRIAPDGIITTLAGTDLPAFAADGSSYFANASMITRRAPGGDVVRVAGTSTGGYDGDGPALTRDLWAANVVAAPDGGVVFGGLTYYPPGPPPPFAIHVNTVRKVTAAGALVTLAGTSLSIANSGDFGPASEAGVFLGLRYDLAGHVLAAHRDGSVDFVTAARTIRRIWPDGLISTIAGNGTQGYAGDGGSAQAAELEPYALVARDGVLYVGDGHGVRAIVPPPPPTEYAVASTDGEQLHVFDLRGRHLRTVDTLTGVAVTRFGYDAADRVITVTDAHQNATTIERAADGTPTAIVGPLGQRTTLTVDASGQLVQLTSPASATTQLTYGAGGLLATLVQPDGRVHRFGYDAEGRLIRDENGAQQAKTLAFQSLAGGGFAVITTTATGLTARQELRFRPGGGADRVFIGPDGTNLVTVAPDSYATARASSPTFTNADGTIDTNQLAPDPLFGVDAAYVARIRFTTPGGVAYEQLEGRTRTLRDPVDLTGGSSVTRTTTVAGDALIEGFDAATRTFSLTSPLGRVTTTVVDARGLPTQQTQPGVDPLVQTHDGNGRLTSVTQGARASTFAIGGNGLPASMTVGARTWGYGWDAAERLTSVTRPSGAVVSYGYDLAGRLTRVTPSGQPAHTIVHTADDHLAEYAPPDVGGHHPVTFTHDADGRLLTRQRADGRIVAMTYSQGRPATITHDGVTGTFGYTPDGRLASFVEAGTAVTPSYDGSLVTGVTWSGTATLPIGYGRDAKLRLTSLTAGSVTTAYTYDRDDLLLTAGGLAYTRDPASGRTTVTALGRVTDALVYDPAGPVAVATTSVDAAPVFRQQLIRDEALRVVSRVEITSAGTVTTGYEYDVDGHLRRVTDNGTPVLTATWDANGNRTAITDARGPLTATFDARDRLVTQGGVAYAYTVDGELASATGAGPVTSYTHDALGQLVSVVVPAGTVIGYTTSALGGRLARSVDGVVVERYLWDRDGRLLATFDAAGATTAVFVYGDGGRLEALRAGASTYRVVTNHLGSVRLVIDTGTGAIVQELGYDAFGRITLDTNPGFQPLGFAGGLTDPATGLVHFGAREYDPGLGRFLERDPLLLGAQSPNLYAYASGDPVNLVDPSGLDHVSDVQTSVNDYLGYAGLGVGTAQLVQWLRFTETTTGTGAAAVTMMTGSMAAKDYCLLGLGEGLAVTGGVIGSATFGFVLGTYAESKMTTGNGKHFYGEALANRLYGDDTKVYAAKGKVDLANNVEMLSRRRQLANPKARALLKGLK